MQGANHRRLDGGVVQTAVLVVSERGELLESVARKQLWKCGVQCMMGVGAVVLVLFLLILFLVLSSVD